MPLSQGYLRWLKNARRDDKDQTRIRIYECEQTNENGVAILENVKDEQLWPAWLTEEKVRELWFITVQLKQVSAVWPRWIRNRYGRIYQDWVMAGEPKMCSRYHTIFMKFFYKVPPPPPIEETTYAAAIVQDSLEEFPAYKQNYYENTSYENALTILERVKDRALWPTWLTDDVLREVWFNEANVSGKRVMIWPLWMRGYYIPYYVEWLKAGVPFSLSMRYPLVYYNLFRSDFMHTAGPRNFQLIKDNLHDRARWPLWALRYSKNTKCKPWNWNEYR